MDILKKTLIKSFRKNGIKKDDYWMVQRSSKNLYLEFYQVKKKDIELIRDILKLCKKYIKYKFNSEFHKGNKEKVKTNKKGDINIEVGNPDSLRVFIYLS